MNWICRLKLHLLAFDEVCGLICFLEARKQIPGHSPTTAEYSRPCEALHPTIPGSDPAFKIKRENAIDASVEEVLLGMVRAVRSRSMAEARR
jgi:hypothetical protein